MKLLRKRTLALALAAALLFSVPASASSSSIANLLDRVTNVASAIEEDLAAAEAVDKTVQSSVVSAEIPDEIPEQGIIIGGTINVRTGPGTDFDRITQLYTGKIVTVLGADSGWYHIQFDDTVGYVLGEYLKMYVPADASMIGEQIVSMAMQYMGTPYRSGGSSPDGFDCSGFTMYLYGQLGYALPHTATGQYVNCGTPVAKEDLQPGDLVFFSDSGAAIGHVGIYIGNDEIIHARSSTHCVTTNSLSMSYYVTRYVGAKRIA